MELTQTIVAAIISSLLLILGFVGWVLFLKYYLTKYMDSEAKQIEEKNTKLRQERKQQRKLLVELSKQSYILNTQIEDSEKCIQQLTAELEELQAEQKKVTAENERLKNKIKELDDDKKT